jgi:hypothetical protein
MTKEELSVSSVHTWAQRFLQAISEGAVDTCFDEWLKSVGEHFAFPEIANGGQEAVPDEPGVYLWGADRTVDGKRHIVPRYVGRAAGTLTLRKRFVSHTGRWERRVGRYVLAPGVSPGDTPPQGTIACLYHDQIRRTLGNMSNSEYKETLKPLVDLQSPAVRGLDAFPQSLVDSFLSKERGHPGSDLRLRHAVDWALHGGANLVHLWAALLPGIAEAEEQLRFAAIRWRRKNGLPPLLNREDSEP